MALVAITVGFAAAGIWIGKDLSGWEWFIPWLIAIGCLIGLYVANARGAQGLALVLLFAFGLLLGISVGSTVYYYAKTDSTAVAQAAAQPHSSRSGSAPADTPPAAISRSCTGSCSGCCWP